MQVGLPVRIPATRTTSNLAADALTSGIIKVGILHDGFSYHFRYENRPRVDRDKICVVSSDNG